MTFLVLINDHSVLHQHLQVRLEFHAFFNQGVQGVGSFELAVTCFGYIDQPRELGFFFIAYAMSALDESDRQRRCLV